MINFAVIKTGGKQYFAEEGKTLTIEKIIGEEAEGYKVGDKITFEEVLMQVAGEKVEIGTPNLKSKVTAEIVEIDRADKVDVVKYKQKSRYFKRKGHRQPYFKVKILKI
jgi:large subunit ribosomal protein L21